MRIFLVIIPLYISYRLLTFPLSFTFISLFVPLHFYFWLIRCLFELAKATSVLQFLLFLRLHLPSFHMYLLMLSRLIDLEQHVSLRHICLLSWHLIHKTWSPWNMANSEAFSSHCDWLQVLKAFSLQLRSPFLYGALVEQCIFAIHYSSYSIYPLQFRLDKTEMPCSLYNLMLSMDTL